MTSTWRIVVAPAVNAAAVAGSTGSSGDPSRAVRGPTCWATFDVAGGGVVVPPEQILETQGGGLVALRGEVAVAFDGGDPLDRGPAPLAETTP